MPSGWKLRICWLRWATALESSLLYLSAGLVVQPPPLAAVSSARLVADLAVKEGPRDSSPREFHRIGDRVVFVASSSTHGTELRSTGLDGRVVQLLVDATPGTEDSWIQYVTEFSGSLAFFAGPIDKTKLYLTDGTPSGTRQVVGSDGSAIHGRFDGLVLLAGIARDRLVLTAPSATTFAETVWSISPNGDAEALRAIPTEAGYGLGFDGLATTGKQFFFQELRPQGGLWLWVSDGTAAGTRFVTSAVQGGSSPGAATNDRYFFVGFEEGRDALMVSDGTEQGTTQLGAWGPHPSMGPRLLVAGAARVYFVIMESDARTRLWQSDGTETGTFPIAGTDQLGFAVDEIDHAWVGERFVFEAQGHHGIELWSHDGSPGVAMKLPAYDDPSPVESPLISLAQAALFVAANAEGGDEIWTTDGTISGTRVLSDFCAVSCPDLDFVFATGVGEVGLFDLVYDSSMFGWSWLTARSDGTTEGTRILSDSALQPSVSIGHAGTAAPVDQGYLVGGWDAAGGGELYHLGDPGGELVLKVNLEPDRDSLDPTDVVAIGDRLYFASASNGDEIAWDLVWPEEVPRALPESPCADGAVRPLASLNGSLLGLGSSWGGRCLLTLDPLSREWRQLPPELRYDFDGSIVQSGDRAFFLRPDFYGDQPWATNGTAEGTSQLPVVGLPPYLELAAATTSRLFLRETYSPGGLLAVSLESFSWQRVHQPAIPHNFGRGSEQILAGTDFYFTDREPGAVEALWVSDGTQSGTRVVWRSVAEENVLELFPAGSTLFFLSSADRVRLWRVENAAPQAELVADLGSSTAASDDESARASLVVGGKLYFVAETAASGAELWVTNGTSAGTKLLDLLPGPKGSAPRWLAEAGSTLFFSADDPLFGTEVWMSDGTEQGSRRLTDIESGSGSAMPERLIGAGGALYFFAEDGVHGRELWALDADGAFLPCAPGPTRLCLLDGRFEVEAFFRPFSGDQNAAAAAALSDQAGYFWFFEPGGVELVVKVVDACGAPAFDNVWFFATGLTNVEVLLSILDTRTGERLVSSSALGEPFSALLETSRFRSCPLTVEVHGPVLPQKLVAAPSSEDACVPGPTTLCLMDGRFEATVEWETLSSTSGLGQSSQIAPESGYFWFFDPKNPELIVRIVDGCEANGNYWLFVGGLTDIGTRLRVRDSQSPQEPLELIHVAGAPFETILETRAFAHCP